MNRLERPRATEENPEKPNLHQKNIVTRHCNYIVDSKASSFQVMVDGKIVKQFISPDAAIEYLKDATLENPARHYYVAMPPQLAPQFIAQRHLISLSAQIGLRKLDFSLQQNRRFK